MDNGSGVVDSSSGSTPFTDEELTVLAMAADPYAPLEPDAAPWDGAVLHQPGLLPDWYMPTPAARRGPLPRVLVITLVAGFLMINAFGLCITSGFISLT